MYYIYAYVADDPNTLFKAVGVTASLVVSTTGGFVYSDIGTSKGIRIATVSDQDGSLTYGPLMVETSQPCYDFAARENFIWCATGVDGEPGVIRIDLSNELSPLSFAYANDLYYSGVTGHQTTSCGFLGTTDRLAYCTTYASSANGYVYSQSTGALMPTGYLTTGYIRYLRFKQYGLD